jgi:hypothetical protein
MSKMIQSMIQEARVKNGKLNQIDAPSVIEYFDMIILIHNMIISLIYDHFIHDH